MRYRLWNIECRSAAVQRCDYRSQRRCIYGSGRLCADILRADCSTLDFRSAGNYHLCRRRNETFCIKDAGISYIGGIKIKYLDLLKKKKIDEFLKGDSLDSYKFLGNHKVEHNGKKGIAFSVWAPNAKAV